jgi:hypothetical protein
MFYFVSWFAMYIISKNKIAPAAAGAIFSQGFAIYHNAITEFFIHLHLCEDKVPIFTVGGPMRSRALLEVNSRGQNSLELVCYCKKRQPTFKSV